MRDRLNIAYQILYDDKLPNIPELSDAAKIGILCGALDTVLAHIDSEDTLAEVLPDTEFVRGVCKAFKERNDYRRSQIRECWTRLVKLAAPDFFEVSENFPKFYE